jgi:hypothetical protein
MNILSGKKLFVLFFSLLIMSVVCEAQVKPGPGIRVPQQQNDRAPKKGTRKVKKTSPAKSKHDQEVKKRKQNKAYNEYVKANRKRALQIQTPEVRERMKNNRKEANTNFDHKRKRIAGGSRKAARKYK